MESKRLAAAASLGRAGAGRRRGLDVISSWGNFGFGPDIFAPLVSFPEDSVTSVTDNNARVSEYNGLSEHLLDYPHSCPLDSCSSSCSSASSSATSSSSGSRSESEPDEDDDDDEPLLSPWSCLKKRLLIISGAAAAGCSGSGKVQGETARSNRTEVSLNRGTTQSQQSTKKPAPYVSLGFRGARPAARELAAGAVDSAPLGPGLGSSGEGAAVGWWSRGREKKGGGG
ncbi:hypothetical protein EJB05_15581, partial [Eragrostis curvula]